MRQFWHLSEIVVPWALLDSPSGWRVGFSLRGHNLALTMFELVESVRLQNVDGFPIGLKNLTGGESVLVNGAVFKTVSETVRTGSGRFDSYTPPPIDCGLLI